jgi:subtilisin family serine protease
MRRRTRPVAATRLGLIAALAVACAFASTLAAPAPDLRAQTPDPPRSAGTPGAVIASGTAEVATAAATAVPSGIGTPPLVISQSSGSGPPEAHTVTVDPAANGMTVSQEAAGALVVTDGIPTADEAVIVQFKGAPLGQARGRGANALAGAARQIASERAQFNRDLPGAAGRSVAVRRDFHEVLDGAAVTVPHGAVDRLRALPYVAAVYPDAQVHVADDASNAVIQAPEAWSAGFTGAGETIAVIDTGIDYTRPDLGGCFGPGCKVKAGFDLINNDPNPMDDHGHGTHVAGIAAANGVMRGVAPDATLLAYKALDVNGVGSESTIIAAIEMAVDPDGDPATGDGADVINLSLGGPGSADDAISQAVDTAVNDGVVVAVAAGNSGPAYNSIESPGTAADAITVAASDGAAAIASFSSRGAQFGAVKPDVAAPGVGIVSTVPTGTCRLCDPSGYRSLTGTSMATPHVAGAAADILSAHPDWTPALVKASLMTTGIVLPGVDSATQGSGVIQLDAAINAPLLIVPARLDFGIDGGAAGSYTASRSIVVSNMTDANTTLTCATSFPTPGVAATCLPAQVTVMSGGIGTFTAQISVDATQVPFLQASPYAYAGNFTVSAPGDTATIPASFQRAHVIDLTFDVPTGGGWVHNGPAFFRAAIPAGVTHADIVVPGDGAYDVMVQFPGFVDAQGAEAERFVVHPGVVVQGSGATTIRSTEAVYRLGAALSVTPYRAFGSASWAFFLGYKSDDVLEYPAFVTYASTFTPVGPPSIAAYVNCLPADYRVEIAVHADESASRSWTADRAWQAACATDNRAYAPADFTRFQYDYTHVIAPGSTVTPIRYRCANLEFVYLCYGFEAEVPIPLTQADEEFETPEMLPGSVWGSMNHDVTTDGFGSTELAWPPYADVSADRHLRLNAEGDYGQFPFIVPDGNLRVGLGPRILWTSASASVTDQTGATYNVDAFGAGRDQFGSYFRDACPSLHFVPDPGNAVSSCNVGEPNLSATLPIGVFTYAGTGPGGAVGGSRVTNFLTDAFTPPVGDVSVGEVRILVGGVPVDALDPGEPADIVAQVTSTQGIGWDCPVPVTIDASTDNGASWMSLPVTQTGHDFTAPFPTGLPTSVRFVSVRVKGTMLCTGGPIVRSAELDVLPAVVIKSADSDGDGMDDTYEAAHRCLDPAVADAGADPDSDGVINLLEFEHATDPCSGDTDGDGTPDKVEVHYGCLDPLVPNPLDADADGLNNVAEVALGTDPCNPDTDGDGLLDGTEAKSTVCNPLIPDPADADGDGLSNTLEMSDGGYTNACNADTNGDGLPDGIAALGPCLNTTAPNDPAADADGDGLSNVAEAQRGTDPCAADSNGDGVPDGTPPVGCDPDNQADPAADPDGDGLTNAEEAQLGSDPCNADSDGDGLADGAEAAAPCLHPLTPDDPTADPDDDGVATRLEIQFRLNPCAADTDADTLTDGFESLAACLDPSAPNDPGADLDGDGLTNLVESADGSDPCSADADGDGYSDPQEIALHANPNVFCPAMRADLNEDAKVNLLDLSMLASTFGEAVPPASPRFDQNADGKINLLDLSRSASVFGQSIAAACP